MDKKIKRLRRAVKTRAKIRQQGAYRLCVFKTPKHTYAQVFSPDGAKVLAAAATVEKAVRSEVKSTGNVEAAKKVGQLIAERAKSAGIDKVAFDRSGFKYHGRIQALADSARENGLTV